jgi:hypothetical protein
MGWFRLIELFVWTTEYFSRSNLAESSKEGYGSKRAGLLMIMVILK